MLVLNGNFVKQFLDMANKLSYILSTFLNTLKRHQNSLLFHLPPHLIKNYKEIALEVMRNCNFWRLLVAKNYLIHFKSF